MTRAAGEKHLRKRFVRPSVSLDPTAGTITATNRNILGSGAEANATARKEPVVAPPSTLNALARHGQSFRTAAAENLDRRVLRRIVSWRSIRSWRQRFSRVATRNNTGMSGRSERQRAATSKPLSPGI